MENHTDKQCTTGTSSVNDRHSQVQHPWCSPYTQPPTCPSCPRVKNDSLAQFRRTYTRTAPRSSSDMRPTSRKHSAHSAHSQRDRAGAAGCDTTQPAAGYLQNCHASPSQRALCPVLWALHGHPSSAAHRLENHSTIAVGAAKSGTLAPRHKQHCSCPDTIHTYQVCKGPVPMPSVYTLKTPVFHTLCSGACAQGLKPQSLHSQPAPATI